MTAKHVVEINELNFESEVLGSSRTFLLSFSAPWCGPCKALTPVLESLAAENVDELTVGKVDIDSSASIATRLGVRGVPTLVTFRDGREISRRVGAGNKAALLALVGRGNVSLRVGAMG